MSAGVSMVLKAGIVPLPFMMVVFTCAAVFLRGRPFHLRVKAWPYDFLARCSGVTCGAVLFEKMFSGSSVASRIRILCGGKAGCQNRRR